MVLKGGRGGELAAADFGGDYVVALEGFLGGEVSADDEGH